MIVIWDLEEDLELKSFDTSLESFMLFDEDGNCFIANEKKDQLTVTQQGVSLKSFPITTNKDEVQTEFTLDKGFRVDRDHNWLLLNQNVILPFSYMTLVIRDHMVDNVPVNDSLTFDIEGFNFNINKKTFLTCNNFVSLNSDALYQTLSTLEQINPDFL